VTVKDEATFIAEYEDSLINAFATRIDQGDKDAVRTLYTSLYCFYVNYGSSFLFKIFSYEARNYSSSATHLITALCHELFNIPRKFHTVSTFSGCWL